MPHVSYVHLCSQEERLLIPPSISNSGSGGRSRPVILKEKEHLKLTCATSGDPKPTVAWSRAGGLTIIEGQSVRESNVASPVLNITAITR